MTGSAGFVGSHLADRMLAEGHSVVGVDNLTTGRADNFEGELVVGDIADRDLLYGVANRVRPELVVHCAASYSNPDFWHRDTDTNVTGTINAALVAKHHRARLVFFQTALPPTSSYAISKIAGEQYIVLSGVPATVFRLANMYGPRNLSGPVPTFFKRLTAGEPCTVVNTRRDMVYVADLVDAVMRAVRERVSGKIDICSGRHLPIADVYAAVAAAVGSDAEPAYAEAGADDVKQMELDPSGAYNKLSWVASTPLHDGIAAAVAWYRDNGVQETWTHLRPKTGSAF